MDPGQQQQALLQFYQHQTINNYLAAINTIRASPSCAPSFISSMLADPSLISVLTPTSLTSPAQSPTSDPWMSSLFAANNPRLPADVSPILPNASTISKPLASYAQPRTQQQINLPSAVQSPNSLNSLAATQLARLQLMTLQAEGKKQAENLKAEQFGLLAMQVALQNGKPSEEALPIGSILQQPAINDRHTSRPEFARLTAKETSLLPKSSAPPILSSPTPESTPSPPYGNSSKCFCSRNFEAHYLSVDEMTSSYYIGTTPKILDRLSQSRFECFSLASFFLSGKELNALYELKKIYSAAKCTIILFT